MVPEHRLLEEFQPTDRLKPDARPAPAFREELRRIPNFRNALSVVSVWVQTLGLMWLAVWADNLVVWVVVFLLMGRAHAQFAALMHEAAHRLLFRNRRWNDWVGRWLLGYPSFTPTDLYRRGHMAHHREEFGPDEPDIPLYRGYPISRASFRRKLVRDATGRTGWKLFKGLLRGVRAPGPAGTQARRIVAVQLVLIAGVDRGRASVGVLAALVPAVPHRVAGDQPTALGRGARRHAALQGPARDDALGEAVVGGPVRARPAQHRLAPRPPRRLRRADEATPPIPRRAAARRVRDRCARVPHLHRALAAFGVGLGSLGRTAPRRLRCLSTRFGHNPNVPGASASNGSGESTFDTIATVMRAQVGARRLAADAIDDATVLAVLDLASRANAGNRWRCEFVVVRDPDVRHQLARIYRQGWSIYRRFLRTHSGDDAELEARQWEADHFEDVPVLIVPCVRGRRPRFPAAGAAAFYGAAYPAVQNLLLAATALGLGAGVTNLALWSSWEARRTLALPRNVTPVAVVPLGPIAGPGGGATAPPTRELGASRPIRAPALPGQRPPANSRRGIMRGHIGPRPGRPGDRRSKEAG